MERKEELQITGQKHVKLTVTKDRITIKVPTEDYDKSLVKFLKDVANNHPNPEYTLRGKYKSDSKVINLRSSFYSNKKYTYHNG